MFRIKICGITNVDDAAVAVEAGACAIGLNLYERSPRFVDKEKVVHQFVGCIAQLPVNRVIPLAGFVCQR